ncbi:MAG: FxDxF family PEP-CTERM protein [Betaproteobacteria bacterium]|nr:FxDxF family PEP-CTERM protein [Betaproteobacteria bacterium]
MLKLLSASLLALGAMSAMPAYANIPDGEFLGTVHDTSNAGDWQVKRLGGTFADGYDWKTPLADPTIPYQDAYNFVHRGWGMPTLWGKSTPWIGAASDGETGAGYYSYKTTFIDDLSQLGSDQSAELKVLNVIFSVDDYLHAIIVNDVQYDGIMSPIVVVGSNYPQYEISDIDWNVGGLNTIEFIVRDVGGFAGLSASMQATYSVTSVPEPETYAMLLAGLGVIGAVARRRKVNVN